jgi:hypothetical protein
MVSDTFQDPMIINPPGGGGPTAYNFSSIGIAWPGEKKKYSSTPGNNFTELVPPPNWQSRFPDGYVNASTVPDLSKDEHFQNWMRTAGLPTFSKLWGRNDSTDMVKGTYNISVQLSECAQRICHK